MPNRDFAWAKIQLPGNHILWAISVHLSTKNAAYRELQGKELKQYIHQNVGPNDFVVLGGDFNTKDQSEPVIKLLSQGLVTTSVPLDINGRNGTNSNRRFQYDWVLASPQLHAMQIPVEFQTKQGSDQRRLRFPNGTVFDTRTLPADILEPALVDDSGSFNMQHMAIVKDFAVPYCGTAP